MLLLILFSFLGGIVTILSPCILPILPIVLSGSVTGGKKRPFGVVTGFVLSFTFFTLFLSGIVRATGLSADSLRVVSIIVIGVFGVSLLLPNFQQKMELLFSRLASLVPSQNPDKHRPDFIAGLFVGVSLGLLWTPCVGPILAGIITLAATSNVGFDAILITLAYAIGTALPMLIVMFTGRSVLQKIKNPVGLQKSFGVLMLLTALAIYFNIDRTFQSYILEVFPNYGAGLTKFEDNTAVKKEIEKLQENPKKSMVSDLIGLNYKTAPEFILGGQWFNSPPLTLSQLRGKVVLVDFWTYTCINCIRTFPYLKSWWEKYKDKGLVIVGVHTPEFAFEKEPKNVQKAIVDFGLTYPVMQDNDYQTWLAYDNHYWPAHYFIDKNGKIRYTHFGEGNYDESEKKIQELLAETGVTEQPEINNQGYTINARTPETYLGSARGDYSRITITGEINKSEEYATPTKGSTLSIQFQAARVFLVMRPKASTPSTVTVYLDDTKVQTIEVAEDKLYELINLETPGSHTLRLEFLDENVELYAFTFG